MKSFALFNTESEKIEGFQLMTWAESQARNEQLRKLGENVRWVRDYTCDENEF